MVAKIYATKEEAKAAKSAQMKVWRAENRVRISEYQKAWIADNRKHVQSYAKESSVEYRQRPEVDIATWTRNLMRNYRLTPDQFNVMWSKQEGKCAVCTAPMQPRGRTKDAVVVDHNHKTGAVRALLCRGCNHGIGSLMDCPEVLESAAKYLREHGNYSSSLIKR